MRPRTFILVTLCLLTLAACSRDDAPYVLATGDADYILSMDQLPDYERSLDHVALAERLSKEFFFQGVQVYRRACFSCHGNVDVPGSIPASRQFWTEPFKGGSDPYALYQTLTRGRGLMPPQVSLTPREKYAVIGFIREAFLQEHNPSQYFEVNRRYLRSLPKGDSLGPRPTRQRPWQKMDYGNWLMRTYEIASADAGPKGITTRGPSPLKNEDFRDRNFAYKGIAIRLDEGPGGVAAGGAFVAFDHDLMRVAAYWTGEGFIDWEDILLDDKHNVFPRIVGDLEFENPMAPGWANPATGTYDDPRFTAVDGRQFGPLPHAWAQYRGVYAHGDRLVVHYTVDSATVLEAFDVHEGGVLSRTLNVSGIQTALEMRAAPADVHTELTGSGAELVSEGGFHVVRFAPGANARITLWMSASDAVAVQRAAENAGAPENLRSLTQGGPQQYTEVLETPIFADEGDGYVVDVLTLPQDNPWQSRMRPTGIDFLEGGSEAVVTTIDGEVWRLENITSAEGPVRWHRIATGLFQPLGVKVVEGDIYVSCRDQIVVLRDLNGDGETDYYEAFNSDHQVTEHFHEFAMGLQTDDAGNFYYAKSGRHARTALIPQHGTLIRVSPDGAESEIIANGFRAANGVLVNDDGSFVVTDQEGFWNPMNRINWVEEGGFYGNMYGYGAPADSTDEGMIQPLVWVDQKYDRSPAELLWADSERWGPLDGALLSLSYGYGKIFVVMPQFFGEVKQAAIVELPVPQFPTGIQRGRFNPMDGQLYVAGMSAWATNQMIQVGGLYRVRYAGGDVHLPSAFEALETGIRLEFAAPLDPAALADPKSYTVTTWELERSRRYGSPRNDVRILPVDNVTVEGTSVTLHIDDIQPTWIVEIIYTLTDPEGNPVKGAVQGTIYELAGVRAES